MDGRDLAVWEDFFGGGLVDCAFVGFLGWGDTKVRSRVAQPLISVLVGVFWGVGWS